MAWLSSTAVRVSRARLTGGELIPWRARPASSSPAVPGWAMASAALSPVVMIGGWLAAEALQPPSYSPVRSTISGLAGLGGTDRWIMISALFVVGAAASRCRRSRFAARLRSTWPGPRSARPRSPYGRPSLPAGHRRSR